MSLWKVLHSRKLTSTLPLRSLSWSDIFLLCLCFYFSHHMMNYSVLQPYRKTTGNPSYVIQNKIQRGERETLGVCVFVCVFVCWCVLDFKTDKTHFIILAKNK